MTVAVLCQWCAARRARVSDILTTLQECCWRMRAQRICYLRATRQAQSTLQSLCGERDTRLSCMDRHQRSQVRRSRTMPLSVIVMREWGHVYTSAVSFQTQSTQSTRALVTELKRLVQETARAQKSAGRTHSKASMASLWLLQPPSSSSSNSVASTPLSTFPPRYSEMLASPAKHWQVLQ